VVEFDVAKDEENRRRRLLPLAAAALLFEGSFVEEEARGASTVKHAS
jgi:hypothetical protein